MKKSAHFNPKSFTWVISLAVMIIVTVGVIFGSQAIYNAANQKYNEPVEIDFTIADTKDIDIASTNAADYAVTLAQEAYDESGTLVAYIVEGNVIGYNQESPIELSTVISAGGELVCSVEVLSQDETEYLGTRIASSDFEGQFEGRYLPVVASTSTDKGSKIDMLANSTISSQAVIDGVNNAKSFVADNFLGNAE